MSKNSQARTMPSRRTGNFVSRAVVVSKPNAILRVERIELSKADRQRLTTNVRMPEVENSSSDDSKYRSK